MEIIIPDVLTCELTEDEATRKKMVFDVSDDLLFIRTQTKNVESNCIILDKDELIKFRNILTCIIDSNLLETEE